MRKGIGKVRRFLLIFFSAILIATTFLTAYIFIEDSTMIVDYGKTKQRHFLPFFERDGVAYEDSELFDKLFEDSVDDIVRMAVIKNQMETDGAYDPKKVVDITAFANRNNVAYDETVSAQYYLDDLINWGNRGIDYKEVSASTMPFEVDTDTVTIAISRYKTVEGKDLLSCASNYQEYQMLVSDLTEATKALFSNYQEYVMYNDRYGVGKSNMLYCIQMYNDGKPVRFTNMEVISIKHTVDEITGLFKKQVKYLYFNPDKMTMVSNTDINAITMQSIINNYSYSFSDNSRIWIGFDNMYSADDGFAQGKRYYDNKTAGSDGIMMLVVVWISFFAYLSLFIYLIIKEGRPAKIETDEDSDKIILKKIDLMPIEFLVVLAFGIVVIDLIVAYYVARYAEKNLFGGVIVYVAIVAGAFILDYTFMPMVLCFVRKVKAKSLWENSCIKWLIVQIRKYTIEAYDNGHALIRTWIPYILFLLCNLIFIILAPIGLIVAVVFDILVGIYLYRNNKERQEIVKSINIISESDIKHQMDTKGMHGDNLELAKAVNNIGDGIRKAVETSMKDEKMKADLITNVSHDIKTPLTSIINYVDLIKREHIQDEKIQGYIDILDQKSQRLKQLTDDLVEASKISSGNIVLNFEKINIVELINQSIGEYEDKFADHGLKCRFTPPQNNIFISVDAKSMFRIIENLYNNIYKYALQGTRVYIEIEQFGVEGAQRVQLSVKNISESQLNMSAQDLVERFKQGDESRKSEGSGLGLSIAKSLTEAMNGQFDIFLDGDLFKVILTFPCVQ